MKWLQLLGQAFSCPWPDAETAAAFQTERRARTLEGVRVLGIAQVAVVLVTWPSDLLLSSDIAWKFAVFRAVVLAQWAVWSVCTRWSSVRDRPDLALIPFALTCPIAAAALGPLTAFDAPWIDVCALVPLFCILFVHAFTTRLVVTVATSATFLGVFLVLRPEQLTSPQLGTFLVSLAVTTIGSIAVGHIAYYLLWEQFLRSRELQAANDSLEGRVAEGTRELASLNERLEILHEEERRRVERSLRDQAQGFLASARSELGALPSSAGVERMTGLLGTLEIQLREVVLDSQGIGDLQSRIVDMLRAAQPSTNAALHCELSSLPDLAPAARLSLYRMVQEAVTNALKHSEAANIRVVGSVGGGVLELAVIDDGRGIDQTRAERRARHRGIGLASLEERARELGAVLCLDGPPEGGTRVVIRLPVDAAV